MDLSQQVIDLNKLQGAADDLARAVHPLSMNAAQIVQAQARWAAIKSVVKQLDASVLGESYDASGQRQLSAENAAKLKRLGIDPKYAGITCESELLELRDNDAARKAFAELKANNVSVDFEGCTNESDARARIAVARAKSKGVAAARSRFGN